MRARPNWRRALFRSRAAIRRATRRKDGDLRLLRGNRFVWAFRSSRIRSGHRAALPVLEKSSTAHPARRQVCAEARTSSSKHEVTVVCATNRPHRLEDMIANYERQSHPHKRLVVVTNSSTFDHSHVRDRIRCVENASTFDVDPDASLGVCLNLALERCSTRFAAKFDDDDRYGTHYLADMLLAHRLADAAIVGKQSYFSYLVHQDRHVLRFPGRELRYTSHVSGATLVIDLPEIGDVRFADTSVGEDTQFLEASQRRGVSIFSSDRFNYVQYRGHDNTWRLPSRDFLASSIAIDPASLAGSIEL